MVSSGAIAEGMKRLGWSSRPHGVHELQAAAAVGQMGLAQIYESALARARHRQRPGAAHPRRPGRPRALPQRPLDADAPCSASASFRSSTRTTRSSTTRSSSATTTRSAPWSPTCSTPTLLVILTDQAGPVLGRSAQGPERDADRSAPRPATRSSSAWPAVPASRIGRGGMLTKVLAAKRAARSGASTVIASGREPDVLLRLAAGESHRHRAGRGDAEGGRAQAVDERPPAAARLGDASTTAPRRKVRGGGKSLLPIGVRRRRRATSIAATSSPCGGASGEEIGRGLSNYSSGEARLIARKPLGRVRAPARLHRRAGADPPRQLRAVVRRLRSAQPIESLPSAGGVGGAGASRRPRRRAGSSAGAGGRPSCGGVDRARRNRSGTSSRWCGRMPERR